MRQVWMPRFILLCAVAALCGGAAFAAMAPDDARELFFPRDDWPALSVDEQRILQPLSGQWAGMRYMERERWRALASHFDRLPPAEQKRVAKRMQRWAAATPDQRHAARSAYQKLKGEGGAEKARAVAAWHDYAAARGISDREADNTPPAGNIVTAQASTP